MGGTPSSTARHASAVPVRPVPHGAPPYLEELPQWLRAPSERPRILVTRGGGPVRGDLQASAVRAAADLDCDLVLIRPAGRLARRLGLSANW